MSPLDAEHLQWAATVLGASPIRVTGLRDGGAPWLLDLPSGQRRAVLRVGADGIQQPEREAAGMRIAAAGGIPVPAVIAELGGGVPLLLIEHVTGSSRQPVTPDEERLRALGSVTARIFTLEPDGVRTGDEPLPVVPHPIPSIDFGQLRAQASPDTLLAEAERRIAAVTPDDPVGLSHGDLWSGNVLWHEGRLVAVLDWDGFGRGCAGVDLGSLRCDAAMCYDGDAPEVVLAGWEEQAGRSADSVAYWDVVAALSTPPDISWFASAISGMTGRPDLTADILRRRRDVFLASALDRLG